MIYHDVMVDTETTNNNNFERGAIIQIAAVRFDYETGLVSDDFFDRCLRVHPGREWDAGTREWWQKQGNVLQTIEARAEDPYTVVHDFYHWLLKDWPTDRPEGLQFWSKPTHFDYVFLASYFRMFGFDVPCGFRFARDLNSFMAGLTGRSTHPEIPVEPAFDGPKHNALFDAIHQIQLLFAMKQQTTQCVILPALEAVG